MTRLIDLSIDIFEGMNVYPGHLKTVTFQHVTHEETALRFEGGFSFQTWGFMMNDNGPTHVDSFSHFNPDPNALTIDQMPLDLFYGDAICLDVSKFAPETDIEASDLDEALANSGQELRRGDIVLFYTGTFNRLKDTPQYLTDFPGLGASASQWIVDKGVKTFGIDTPTPDNPISKTYPCHMMCRANSITHYENLANLDQVANKRFTFIGLPLKVRGAHGGPTRAVALVED
ncbi:MAG: cyclase family protein [Chloroflexi bacterium]|nr:cyclase family protein [Chloroflexota bacterium]